MESHNLIRSERFHEIFYHDWSFKVRVAQLIFWSKMVQAMASCIIAPSHYQNQHWLIIINDLGGKAQDSSNLKCVWSHIFKVTATSPRGQWVNQPWVHSLKCPCQCEGHICHSWNMGLVLRGARTGLVAPAHWCLEDGNDGRLTWGSLENYFVICIDWWFLKLWHLWIICLFDINCMFLQ